MKVLLDTNVLVSGIFWTGTPRKILEAWKEDQFSLVVSPQIMQEYRRVLEMMSQKQPMTIIDQILDLISVNAEMVNPVVFLKPVCTDHDDDKFLEAAIAAKAHYIVSGDKALLTVGSIKNSLVVTAKQFEQQLPLLGFLDDNLLAAGQVLQKMAENNRIDTQHAL